MNIVHVKWLDANGGVREKWRPLSSMSGKPTIAHSLGAVLQDDVECIVICPHWTDDGDGDGEITIPKGCVVSVEIVGEA